jgi:hypothetical protein
MSVNKAISNILDKNLDEMRVNFSSALSEKAVMKLDEKKAKIGKGYFGQVSEEAEQIDEISWQLAGHASRKADQKSREAKSFKEKNKYAKQSDRLLKKSKQKLKAEIDYLHYGKKG